MAIEDYFKGSSQAYGQLAGSLLAGRRKEDKKQAKRALLASVVMNTFGALQNQQKQTIVDGANDVKEKYSDIFNQNKQEFEAYAPERALLKRYNDNPETFLNEEVAKIINNTDEATAARVTWNDIDNEPDEELRKSMYAAHNSEKQKLVDKMEKLKLDPRATTKTVTAYNQRATEEYKAALALVEDDPTKKGLVKAAWNRIFKTKRDDDGELVTTNSDLLDLQAALKNAKDNRTTFRDLKDREITKRSLINPLVFKDKDVDMSKVYLEVGNKLANVAGEYDKYKGTDRRFIDSIINTVVAEDASLSKEEILNKGLELIRGNALDTDAYLTRESNKEATGRLLIDTYNKQTEDEKIEAFKNNPSLLYQITDAYIQDGRRAEASNILETYKDLNPDYQEFEPTPNILTNRVGTIEQRIKNDPTKDVLILNDRTYLGNLANRVAHTEHLFKYNNPDWSKEFTEPQLTDASVSFVLENDKVGDPTNVRMTKAHMLPYKQDITEEYVLETLPLIIDEFNKTYPNTKTREKEVTSFRDGFIDSIKAKKEMSDDEVLNITNKIDKLLENETTNNYKDSKILQENITDQLGQKGLVDYHVARRDLSLNKEVLNNAISKMNFESLSNEELKYLYPDVGYFTGSVDDKQIKQVLGLNNDINLDVTPLRIKIRNILKERLPESPRKDRSNIQQFLNSSTIKPVIPDNRFILDFRRELLSSEGTGNPTYGYKRYTEKFGR